MSTTAAAADASTQTTELPSAQLTRQLSSAYLACAVHTAVVATPRSNQASQKPCLELGSHPNTSGAAWVPCCWQGRSCTASALVRQFRLIKRRNGATTSTSGKVHLKNTIEQLKLAGPKSLGVCLLTASFIGMCFTIQFVREFSKLGLTRAIGGVLALSLARELTPVITSVILAGRVGSAFAAELGTMQVVGLFFTCMTFLRSTAFLCIAVFWQQPHHTLHRCRYQSRWTACVSLVVTQSIT